MPSSADGFARFARELGEDPETIVSYLELCDLDPLPAVIRCAQDAGALTPQQAAQLTANVSPDRFADLVAPDDPLVLTPEAMRNVPQGAFIAFIYLDPPDAAATTGPIRRAKRHLLHVMVSLGDGWAAGTQGANAGLPVRTANWQSVDLTGSLNWHRFAGTYDAVAESRGNGSPRHLRIRYRQIEKFQQPGTAGAAAATRRPLIPPADFENYYEGEGWWWLKSPKNMPSEGWKLHVSCNETNAVQIATLVLPKLRERDIFHKFLGTREEVALQNANPVQCGKVIAILPDNIVEAFDAVGVVDAALGGRVIRRDSPPIDKENPVGQTVVYTRYGPFQGNFIVNEAGTGYEPDPKGVPYPGWIQNPWPGYPNQTNLNKFPAWPKHLLAYPGESKRYWKLRLARGATDDV